MSRAVCLLFSRASTLHASYEFKDIVIRVCDQIYEITLPEEEGFGSTKVMPSVFMYVS